MNYFLLFVIILKINYKSFSVIWNTKKRTKLSYGVMVTGWPTW